MLQTDTNQQLNEVLHQFFRLGFGDRLMYSSDYPHWDFDPPQSVLPAGTPLELRKQVLATNAAGLYGLSLPS
jgi:predicted TIM-barrel fold metal-dependent hydrolase